MKTTLLFTLIASCAFAQEPVRIMMDKIGAEQVGVGAMAGGNIKGAPYSATIVTEMIQTLADGNRIVQKNEGAVARDSQGRMRHEAILPIIGNLTARNTPKMVFINDPVSGANYSLNAAEKTFRKMPGFTAGAPGVVTFERKASAERLAIERPAPGSVGGTISAIRVPAPPPNAGVEVHFDAALSNGPGVRVSAEQMQYKNESLGTKVIDGVVAEGTRSVRTIQVGEIGNERAIEIVSESWFSTDLKTVVYSKRSDPRSGDMIYSLTNISRAEPDASLFAVPADYKAAPDFDVNMKMRQAGGAGEVIIYKPE